MAKIQKSPAGYRSLLGLVGADQAPLDVDGDLTPTLDTHPFYLSRSLVVKRASAVAASLNGSGSLATLTVPATESWYVYALGGQLDTISAGAADIYCAISVQIQNITTPVFEHQWPANLNPGDTLRFGGPIEPVVLNAGVNIFFQNNKAVVRTASVFVTALVSVLNAT